MEIFVYCKGQRMVNEGFSPDKLPELLADEDNLVWVDMEKPNEADEKVLADVFHFHPLTIEDAVATRNQPKVEAFPDYLFFIFHGVKLETNSYNFVTKELDGYLGKNFVVTYHHENFRSIDKVKQQVRNSPFVCGRGADYLLHQILDELVDLYVPVVDDFDRAISDMEDRIFRSKTANDTILEEILNLKRSIARLRRITSKQLSVLYRISRGELPLIEESHLPFYRDVYDHLLRVGDLAESYRELISGLLDIQFNVVSNRTNEIVKVLTIFSAIILPLSLIAGIYGMNFDDMPELHTRDGYFVTLGVMGLIVVGLLFYFWRKGWIFEKEEIPKGSDEADVIHRTEIG
ncbi:MAG: magnesium/cobalt transporter CorA [Acidobacteriota bacterium]|nr:magnesium/cobalt transporter CorA [Acidobacteriota bacterium]